MLEDDIYTALSNAAALSALVSTRIYPVIAPAGVAAPFVVWQRITSIPATTRAEAAQVEEVLVQFSCYAANHAAANAVRSAVITALDTVTLSGGDSPTLADTRNDYDAAADLHRADVDFLI